MSVIDCIECVRDFYKNVLKQNCRVITVIKEKDRWKAVCEVDVDREYTTRKGIGDMVELYEVYVNDNQEILGYQQTATRPKAEAYNEE